MQTAEIFHPIREAVGYIRNLAGGVYGNTPLLTRDEVGVPTTTTRTLPQLSIEDLFEAKLGELIYGRSLLSDPITHAPLGVLDILRAFHFNEETIDRIHHQVNCQMMVLHQSIVKEYGTGAFITFWVARPGYLTIRVVTSHVSAETQQQPVGAL